ncbi:hypothetical protein J1614_004128 [Plenodomus biglobosus]|nr:hypothetical protein J1614_004128 [Plenodomus biglobosus]
MRQAHLFFHIFPVNQILNKLRTLRVIFGVRSTEPWNFHFISITRTFPCTQSIYVSVLEHCRPVITHIPYVLMTTVAKSDRT